jgi:branched-chain amino acid transport system ATP-binding protein
MAEPLLRVQGLTKSFGAVAANRAIDLEVAPGEAHAVIGPNGAGKTTLLAQLAGELSPDAGRICFGGTEITREPAHRRAHRGIARSFQITSLLEDFTAEENVALAVQAHQGHSFKFWRAAQDDPRLRGPARQILDQLGLGARAAVPAGTLAHGEQRSLELAMALASRPSLLLLDEPMAGMGPRESAQMIALLASLKERIAMLLIEHDMDAVFRLADRITVLVEGRAIASGSPEEIRNSAAVQRAYLGEGG